MPSLVRQPAVAGFFYPADPRELGSVVDGLIDCGEPSVSHPKALIAPHAGYIYSGPTAGIAMATLVEDRDHIERVVLLGPSHFVAFAGLAASRAEVFRTPLGPVPVDVELRDRLLELPHVLIDDRAHAREHSLEVLLPFLQRALRHFEVVPLAVGDASPEEVGAVLERAWGDGATRIVVSSDLSHYQDYRTAQRRDRTTCEAIERLDAAALGPTDACGCRAVAGLLEIARRRGLSARTLDLRNSGDTAGPRDSVVGYGAWAFG